MHLVNSTVYDSGSTGPPSLRREKQPIPELGMELPSEILENILSKLPFSSLVRFRAVSKHWRSVLIPVAARNGQTGRTLRLSCAHCDKGRILMDFVKIDKTVSTCLRRSYILPEELASKPAQLKKVMACDRGPLFCAMLALKPVYLKKVMACDRGLLFCAMGSSNDTEKILVLNPLTNKSRQLHLPDSLRHSPHRLDGETMPILVGVVVDAKSGNYELVVAGCKTKRDRGTYKERGYRMFLYDSSTDGWTNGPSFLPVLPQPQAQIGLFLLQRSTQSALCNGNLY